jgi:tetratricopeptide (TPR) repeat protein
MWAGWLAVTLLALGRLCAGEFTWWDDRLTLFQNPWMTPPTWGTLAHYWTEPYMGLYIPVTYMLWAGLAAIGQLSAADERGITLNPYVFHTASLLLHAANATLVYAILRRLIRNDFAAAVGAAVFALHPIQVEAVGWISGMKDVLGATFALLAMWNHLRAESPKIRRWKYWLAVACFVLGMLSKPGIVVFPLILASIDHWLRNRPWRDAIRTLWPFFLLAIPCLIWTKIIQDVPPRAELWTRPLVASDAIAFYIGKLLWPINLTLDYGRSPTRLLHSGQLWWTWTIPAAIAIALYLRRRQSPGLIAGTCIFLAGIFPVLGLTPFMFQAFSTTADHYLYLSMFGVAIAVAWTVDRWRFRPAVQWAPVLIIPLLAARSFLQAGIWLDNESLFTHALAVNPDSYVSHAHLASEYEVRASLEKSPADQSRLLELAEHHQRDAVRIAPDRFDAWENLGLLLIKRNNPAEALPAIEHALTLESQATPATAARLHHALGALLWQAGRRDDAINHFEQATRLDPADETYRSTLLSARQNK